MKTTRSIGLRRWVGLATLLLASSVLPTLAADLDQTITFSIPAGRLSDALIQFSRQSHIQVLSSGDRAVRAATPGLSGTYTVRAALDALLSPSHLKYRATSADTVILESAADSQLAFDLAAGPLDRALEQFRQQSSLAVVAPKEVIAGKKGKAVRGTMAPVDALRRLLKASGLTFVRAGDDSITIQAGTVDAEGPVAADVSVQSQRVIQVYTAGGNVDIPRTVDDVQPYYVFDSETIENSGAQNVEDFLKQYLTMNTVAYSNNQMYGPFAQNSGSTGGAIGLLGNTSTVNLRGLGPNETLILVDGRRMAGVTFQGTSEQPDINGIPMAAIDRIEVLPSGSGAIYGGSAMGGVINIILKKNYNGGDFKYSYDNVTKGSSAINTVDGSYGFSLNDGKTRVMIAAHYSDSDPLLTGDRADLIERGLNTLLKNDPNIFATVPPLNNAFLGGTTPNIVSDSRDSNGNLIPLTLINGTPLNAYGTYLCPGSSPSTSRATLNTCLLANAGKQNLVLAPGVGEFGLGQPLGFSAQVESALVTVRQSLTSWLEAFGEVSIERNNGSSLYNPISDNQWYVPAGAPSNPFQQAVFIHFPSTVAVPFTVSSLTRAFTGGLVATLPHGWTSEIDYTWSGNSFNNLFYQSDNDALDGFGPPYEPLVGVLVTGSLNPFVDTGKYPLNINPYLAPESYGSKSTLNDVAWRASGPLHALPWGAPTLTLGLEHREEGYPTNTQYQTFPFATYANEYTTYFGQHQSTDSLYGETHIPLVANSNAVPGIRSIELQLAGRIDRYSVDTGTTSVTVEPNPYNVPGPYFCYSPSSSTGAFPNNCNTPVPGATTSYNSVNETFGLKYKPIDDIAVRASLATAFLPPTYSQLLPNTTVMPNGDYVTDPKTGAQYSVSTITGGSPNVKPEHDRSWDVGLIYQPQEDALKGLRIDFEYYQIKQLDAIVSIDGNQILSDPTLAAARVTRDPVTGLITVINESLVNAPEYKTEGFDLAFDYRKSTPIGVFELRALGTFIDHEYRQIAYGAPLVDYVGWTDEGGEAKAKANATLTWSYRQWNLGWTTRYYGGYSANGAAGDPVVGLVPYLTANQGSDRIPAQIYHDFVATYSLAKAGSTNRWLSPLTIQLGVKNVFNAWPPFDANYPPFYSSPYGDVRLREYRVSIRASF